MMITMMSSESVTRRSRGNFPIGLLVVNCLICTITTHAFRLPLYRHRRHHLQQHLVAFIVGPSSSAASLSSSSRSEGLRDSELSSFESDKLLEEFIREVATEALFPVFYPPPTTTMVQPEKALQRVLRRFQNNSLPIMAYNNSIENTNKENKENRARRNVIRRRLSDLILGTAVMRIRHYFTYLASVMVALEPEQPHPNVVNPPIAGLDAKLWNDTMLLLDNEKDYGAPPPQQPSSSSSFLLQTVRAMVDLHAEYLTMEPKQQQTTDDNDDLAMIIRHLKQGKLNVTNAGRSGSTRSSSITTTNSTRTTANNDDADMNITRTAMIYSLPWFFVQMLVEQYGIVQTEAMARVFNQPGPITIRCNSIRMLQDKDDSNDDDSHLCERLWREEGIRAVPLSNTTNIASAALPHSLHDHNMNDNEPIAFPPGCIRLVVDNKNSSSNCWSPAQKSLWSMSTWKDGWFEVQDAGSQLIVEAAEVDANDVVVDYCAGNGGKTFALASRMYKKQQQQSREKNDDNGVGNGVGRVIAHDIVEARLRNIQGNLHRVLGLPDGDDDDDASNRTMKSEECRRLPIIRTTLDPSTAASLQQDDTSNKFAADVVLVDAPCSSTGVLRRRPSQRFRWKSKADITAYFPSLQLEILLKAAALVVKGGNGRLVYATCSICKHENQEVVDAFEKASGGSKWVRWDFPSNCSERKSSNCYPHCRSLLPTEYGSDGFFIARWKRR